MNDEILNKLLMDLFNLKKYTFLQLKIDYY